jgi:hypothetical protein
VRDIACQYRRCIISTKLPVITFSVHVNATCQACFDLARNIEFHVTSMEHTGERVIGGVRSGLIGPDEEVTWEARHFLVRQRLTSRITGFDAPRWFRDSQIRDAFARFDHDHYFEDAGHGETLVTERFDYTSPLGALGKLADVLFLRRYMHDLLWRRAMMLKTAAESGVH